MVAFLRELSWSVHAWGPALTRPCARACYSMSVPCVRVATVGHPCSSTRACARHVLYVTACVALCECTPLYGAGEEPPPVSPAPSDGGEHSQEPPPSVFAVTWSTRPSDRTPFDVPDSNRRGVAVDLGRIFRLRVQMYKHLALPAVQRWLTLRRIIPTGVEGEVNRDGAELVVLAGVHHDVPGVFVRSLHSPEPGGPFTLFPLKRGAASDLDLQELGLRPYYRLDHGPPNGVERLSASIVRAIHDVYVELRLPNDLPRRAGVLVEPSMWSTRRGTGRTALFGAEAVVGHGRGSPFLRIPCFPWRNIVVAHSSTTRDGHDPSYRVLESRPTGFITIHRYTRDVRCVA